MHIEALKHGRCRHGNTQRSLKVQAHYSSHLATENDVPVTWPVLILAEVDLNFSSAIKARSVCEHISVEQNVLESGMLQQSVSIVF